MIMETKTKTVRLNSEKKIDNEYFKVKIGTTNKVNPIVIYYDGRTFIEPTVEKYSYNVDINEIKRYFKSLIQNKIADSKLFANKIIFDFQVAQSGVAYNKKSFLSFQLLLKQKDENNILKLLDVKKVSEKTFNEILNSVADYIKTRDFDITLKR